MTTPSQHSDFEEKLKDRIADILGNDYTQNCAYIDTKNDSCHIRGYVGLPTYTRHNRTGQYLFINQRGVVSPGISYAVRDGYGTSLINGRHPVFVLHLTLDGSLVDVNVHPQKREVRLRQEQQIRELILKAVQSTLRNNTSFINSTENIATISPVFSNTFQNRASTSTSGSEDSNAWVFRPKPHLSKEAPQPYSYIPQTTPEAPLPKEPPKAPEIHIQQHFAVPSETTPFQHYPPKVLATISRFIILDSTIPNNFIAGSCLQQEKGGLIIVNQRAAHSRVIFEKLSQTDLSGPLAQQTLLIPHPIEVSPFETEMLKSHLPHLNSLGIQIKEFGSNTFLIDAIPQIFGNSNLEVLVSDIIHSLRESTDASLDGSRAKSIAQAASRAAISSDRRLTLEEAQSLLNQLSRCQHPYQCPTGKPIMIQITTDELAKYFTK